MIKLTLKDGSIKEVEQGSTIYEVAKQISEGLARVATCGIVNGEVKDLRYELQEDCNLSIETFDSKIDVEKSYRASNEKGSFFIKDEKKSTKILIILSWILPFYGLFFIYLAKMSLYEKAKSMVCKILNFGFTVILIEFMLVSAIQMLAFSKVPGFVIYTLISIILGIFVWAIIEHIIATSKWLKNEDYSYKFTTEIFKPWNNIN